MTHKRLQNAWQKVIDETHDKPKIIGSYPPKIVVFRRLLFLAGFALGKIEDGENTGFHTIIFNKIINFYNQQKKCLKAYF